MKAIVDLFMVPSMWEYLSIECDHNLFCNEPGLVCLLLIVASHPRRLRNEVVVVSASQKTGRAMR